MLPFARIEGTGRARYIASRIASAHACLRVRRSERYADCRAFAQHGFLAERRAIALHDVADRGVGCRVIGVNDRDDAARLRHGRAVRSAPRAVRVEHRKAFRECMTENVVLEAFPVGIADRSAARNREPEVERVAKAECSSMRQYSRCSRVHSTAQPESASSIAVTIVARCAMLLSWPEPVRMGAMRAVYTKRGVAGERSVDRGAALRAPRRRRDRAARAAVRPKRNSGCRR